MRTADNPHPENIETHPRTHPTATHPYQLTSSSRTMTRSRPSASATPRATSRSRYRSCARSRSGGTSARRRTSSTTGRTRGAALALRPPGRASRCVSLGWLFGSGGGYGGLAAEKHQRRGGGGEKSGAVRRRLVHRQLLLRLLLLLAGSAAAAVAAAVPVAGVSDLFERGTVGRSNVNLAVNVRHHALPVVVCRNGLNPTGRFAAVAAVPPFACPFPPIHPADAIRKWRSGSAWRRMPTKSSSLSSTALSTTRFVRPSVRPSVS